MSIRTRIDSMIDTTTLEPVYGVGVSFEKGRWARLARDGQLFHTKDLEEAEAMIAEVLSRAKEQAT
jgi:hypothetical protein